MNPSGIRNVSQNTRTEKRYLREKVGRYYRAEVPIHKVHFKLTIF